MRRARERVCRRAALGVGERRIREWRVARQRPLAGCCGRSRERKRCARCPGWVGGQDGHSIAPALWPDSHRGALAPGTVCEVPHMITMLDVLLGC